MNLSIPYVRRDLAINDQTDEFQIIYDKNSKLENLSFFANLYSDKIINVLFSEDLNITSCADLILNSGCKNIVAVFPVLPTRQEADYFTRSGVKFYTLVPASSFYALSYYVSIGVSSIFIVRDLWHNLPAVKKKLGDISLRMHGDMNGTSYEFTENDEEYYTTFIPRPEDYFLLDEYVDVIQFNTVEENELSVLYKVWIKNHQWLGNISEILFFDHNRGAADFPNSLMLKDFTKMKINCGAVCVISGSRCRACRHAIEFARLLKEKGEQFNDS